MRDDRMPPSNMPAEISAEGGAVYPVEPGQMTLAERLVETVDRIRQLNTSLGLRPYRVFLIHVQWSGAKIGLGQPKEISRREILPTPRVRDISSTSEVYTNMGRVEEGGVVIDEVSARFSEDDLMGKTSDLLDPAAPRSGQKNAEFFYEVVESRAIAPNPIPRRYTPSAVPTLNRGNCSWRIVLSKVMANRSRQQTFDRQEA
jgi:hypothetical protein